MITIEDLSILNDSEYQTENNKFSIIEKEKNNKVLMELEIDINNKSMIKMFCKKDQNSQEKDQCKIIFLKFQNFPDGIYLEVLDEQIICHIYELKTSPVSSDKLNKISMQFLNAKFHLISLFSILELDMSKVKFKYNIGYINDMNLRDEYNLKRQPKVIPGQALTHPRHISDWLDSKVSFVIGKHKFEESFTKLQMEFLNVESNNYNYYKKELSL